MAEELEVTCNDVCIIFLGDFPELAEATSRLFAVVLIRCAEMAVYVLLSSFDGLLNLDLTKKYLKPTEYCFAVPEISVDVHTLRFKGAFVSKDELVGTLVDVELLLRVPAVGPRRSRTIVSCRGSVPNTSRSNPAGGGIGCVPVVIGSTVGVGLERRTDHRATDLPC